jgi:hypothetical protein
MPSLHCSLSSVRIRPHIFPISSANHRQKETQYESLQVETSDNWNKWQTQCITVQQVTSFHRHRTAGERRSINWKLRHTNCAKQTATHELRQTIRATRTAPHELRQTICATRTAPHKLRHTNCLTTSCETAMLQILHRLILKLLADVQGDQKVSLHLMLQYRTLQVKFKMSAADRQGQADTRLTLTPSVIPNSNYVIMVSDWNCLK